MKDLQKLTKEELGNLINKLESDMKKFVDIKDMKKLHNTNKTLGTLISLYMKK
jgi:hypothetical protein